MKLLNTIVCLVLLTACRVSLGDALPLEAGAARCDLDSNEARGCSIRWDLSATPRSSYVIQWLSPKSGRWEPVFERRFWSPHETGGWVSTGRLYRVLGCDDRSALRSCVSTTAFWAPEIPPADRMPDSVSIAEADGRSVVAAISRDADRYTQVMQLNVYLLADVLQRSPDAPLPPMNAPAEPGEPGDLAHDVHHNVHSNYELVRRNRALKLSQRSVNND